MTQAESRNDKYLKNGRNTSREGHIHNTYLKEFQDVNNNSVRWP